MFVCKKFALFDGKQFADFVLELLLLRFYTCSQAETPLHLVSLSTKQVNKSFWKDICEKCPSSIKKYHGSVGLCKWTGIQIFKIKNFQKTFYKSLFLPRKLRSVFLQSWHAILQFQRSPGSRRHSVYVALYLAKTLV